MTESRFDTEYLIDKDLLLMDLQARGGLTEEDAEYATLLVEDGCTFDEIVDMLSITNATRTETYYEEPTVIDQNGPIDWFEAAQDICLAPYMEEAA